MFPQINNMYQPQMVGQTLPGKIITREEDIAVTDVPMGNKPSVFVLNDGSAIYLKFWTSSGLISTVKFVQDAPQEKEPEFQMASLIPQSSPNKPKESNYATIQDLESINKRLDEIVKALNNPTRKTDRFVKEQRGDENDE